jgi:hypothetical protein
MGKRDKMKVPPSLQPAVQYLRELALDYPETREDHPWGHAAFKVKDKVFLSLAEWVDESFRAIAPKKLVALLPHPDDIAIPGVRVIIGPPKRKARKPRKATANKRPARAR